MNVRSLAVVVVVQRDRRAAEAPAGTRHAPPRDLRFTHEVRGASLAAYRHTHQVTRALPRCRHRAPHAGPFLFSDFTEPDHDRTSATPATTATRGHDPAPL